jgi:hypothetical protein
MLSICLNTTFTVTYTQRHLNWLPLTLSNLLPIICFAIKAAIFTIDDFQLLKNTSKDFRV